MNGGGKKNHEEEGKRMEKSRMSVEKKRLDSAVVAGGVVEKGHLVVGPLGREDRLNAHRTDGRSASSCRSWAGRSSFRMWRRASHKRHGSRQHWKQCWRRSSR
jgi:hypothetical protein